MNIHDCMTVGYLLKFIKDNNISDDAVILSQRVEDSYYTDSIGWNETSTFKETDFGPTQYQPIWCPVKYKDDNNLYLDLHY